ncbi:DUF4405 domain-containing protein [Lutimonas sp.]|uniref:DUF4405 domain-containing protein n=1 Tax=Lutimonas sp. TaxID=1872403 RepID=UPI003D9B58C3
MKKKTSKLRVFVDLFFFALMILVLIPQTTGIAIHEWASFIILAPFVLHVLINWKWIASNSRKIFKKQSEKSRFDYAFNWLLYLLMILVTVSGIVISESVLPIFGIHVEPDSFWSKIHDVSATLFMAFLGVHLALHWKWIINSLRKLRWKTDLHHLTKIRGIILDRSAQLFIFIGISVLLSMAFWMFEYSDWAQEMRLGAGNNEVERSKEMPKKWMLFVLPLLKVTILMTIPALLAGGVIRLKDYLKVLKSKSR